MHLATTDAGNDLLDRDPLALLTGMLLDQQIPMEKAFTSPSVLLERLGGDADALDAAQIAALDPDALVELFRTPPALHRFPGSMAARVQELCQVLVREYGGRAEAVWADVDTGEELLARVAALPGFGAQKAKIFVALLGKRYGVQPAGWREAAGSYGEEGSYRSVADVVDAASLLKVRSTKQEAKRAAKAAAGEGTR
ncbi:HhH-GPD-type base excision DNA repair protein [Angustibacter luteus]|uniref:HhH-GPD-type base excision DNA repair protein n=1 Tax=Angustibacter luteus TaxID=658456 RepID=A0ABW1JBE7_9ACTN